MSIRFPNRVAQTGTYHAQAGWDTPAYLEIDGPALAGMRTFSAVADLFDGDVLGISVVSVNDPTIWGVYSATWRASDGALVLVDGSETETDANFPDDDAVEITACATEATLTAAYGGAVRLAAGSYNPTATTLHFTLEGDPDPTPAIGVLYATAQDVGDAEAALMGPTYWYDYSNPSLTWGSGYWQFAITSGEELVDLQARSYARNLMGLAASVAVDLYIPASAPSEAQSIQLVCGVHEESDSQWIWGTNVGTDYTVGVATTVTLRCGVKPNGSIMLAYLGNAVASGYRITNIVFSSAAL